MVKVTLLSIGQARLGDFNYFLEHIFLFDQNQYCIQTCKKSSLNIGHKN